MEPFRIHVFICDQHKPEGVPSCPVRGSGATIDAFRKEVAGRGLLDDVQITLCGSLGVCERGPNMVVYPEGVWYSGVRPEDVAEIVESHFVNGQPVARLMNQDPVALKSEIRWNRDRMLAAMRARDVSGALPDELVQSIRGYQESRILLTALELDLFSLAAAAAPEGATAEEIAATAKSDPRATEMLLNALVALGLMKKSGGSFAPAPLARRYFTAGSKDDARLATLHHQSLWERWSHLTECVRTGAPPELTEHSQRGEDWTRWFIAAMHKNASERAPLVVTATGIEGVRRVLDVGGGSGAYAIAFARANEALEVDVFDLETVLPLTRAHIAEAGLQSRIHTRAGDLRTDDFGNGYDLVFVSAICHMLDSSGNADLMRRCYAALAPGGRIVIQDFILDPDRTSPRHAALFSINMLTGTLGGSSYSESDYVSWLTSADFVKIDRIRIPGPTNLIAAARQRN